MMGTNKRDVDSCGQCLKYLMFGMNFLFFLMGGTIMGIGIWIIVDRNFMSAILGTDLMTAAAYLVVVGGAIVTVISLLGCLGAMLENKCLLLVYLIVLILMFAGLLVAGVLAIILKTQYFILLSVIFTALLIGGILAIVFRVEVRDEVKTYMREKLQKNYGVDLDEKWNALITDAWNDAQRTFKENIVIPKMRETLTYYYGVDLENSYNRAVTDGWDGAQTHLYCCAVEDSSWALYKGSEWYKVQPGVVDVSKPLVPVSCCVRDQNDHYINREKCQMWQDGPPTVKGGNENEALFSRGCYTAGYDYVMEYSGYLIGMAIGVAVALITGIVFSLMMYRMI